MSNVFDTGTADDAVEDNGLISVLNDMLTIAQHQTIKRKDDDDNILFIKTVNIHPTYGAQTFPNRIPCDLLIN